jgi:hypothetical protein
MIPFVISSVRPVRFENPSIAFRLKARSNLPHLVEGCERGGAMEEFVQLFRKSLKQRLGDAADVEAMVADGDAGDIPATTVLHRLCPEEGGEWDGRTWVG